MIVARFHIEESPGGRHLVGATTSNWPLTVGAKLVLRKRGDEYELLELDERKPVKPTPEALASFLPNES